MSSGLGQEARSEQELPRARLERERIIVHEILGECGRQFGGQARGRRAGFTCRQFSMTLVRKGGVSSRIFTGGM